MVLHVRARLGPYRRALAGRDFRVLWLGSSLSLVGDGMTFVALTWLVLAREGGAGQLGLLAVCYTLPVFAGGLMAGPVLDRFDKRHVLAVDSVVRGLAVASVPLASVLGGVPEPLPYVVAAVYGLFKMIPLAGFPAAIPDLVEPRDRDVANALESVSFSVAGVAGPALAGFLIGTIGSELVLAFDALSYAVFAITALTVRRPLTPSPAHPTAPPPEHPSPPPPDHPGIPTHRSQDHPDDPSPMPPTTPVVRVEPDNPVSPVSPVSPATPATPLSQATPARSATCLPGRHGKKLRFLFRDRVLVVTTLAFMAFNVAEGMLLVAAPWLAKTQLTGGAQTLGALLSALAVGELLGAAAAGTRSPGRHPLRAIATVQLLAATGFLAVLATPNTWAVAVGFLVIGLFSAPMTVWAQSLRMARIPAPMRGRGFALLRTLMQATPPLGAAAVTPLLSTGRLGGAALTMLVIAAGPVVALVWAGGAVTAGTTSDVRSDPPDRREPTSAGGVGVAPP
ncbi:MFS transporter [Nonomuraea endophytica]|uniref:MFS transporter n=1 Tax=Nonomuraea endophytica TaxID=714136 RepID=UPI0037CACBB9